MKAGYGNGVTVSELQEVFSITEREAKKSLRELERSGEIHNVGPNPNVKKGEDEWELKPDDEN